MVDSPSSLDHLESFRVEQAPPTVHYIPSFISESDEQLILQQVYSAPKPKWTQLSGRRLQNWGGFPHPKGMVAEKLPDWLEKYTEKVSSLGVFGGKVANHVLINEYNPMEGIMPHEDGPLYFPTVTTISLGSHALLDFYQPISKKEKTEQAVGDNESCPQMEENRYFLSLLLAPRSLLILQDDMYVQYLHGIKPVREDVVTEKIVNLGSCDVKPGDVLTRGTRVSLTIRHVPKVLKTTILLGRR
ncbi:alpha-ketoglutarate-dependent dioxygenase alkB homolog 6 [Latimeria chalumnae]|uniref:AlkB homolog 6 n=1 Tax=Latimeria chalumnae TaxID=7897 RepID=H2ZZE0_LATCH|nr:PREDICTED: alpha-ketoglutarate-dependent dioxygenase alkB homolog 6 [Latimeria chalumnae]XP_005987842.1 PREDICTED: alpha-ketoglutarate-dependent dioxygenase alkB homolog 6 [Latimeria chalumnae]|eukprot:XP_005987841.1 PREDICTED: alpha-ketoglutarate-dependent dioxygenase alkB homolog 6 [Latimeria chalumnae]